MITNSRKIDHSRVIPTKSIKGHIVINGKAYPVDEIIEAALSESYSELKHDGDDIILGRKRISPIYKSEQEKAMAALCYGSLIYCCPASKPCAERDHALEVLGISLEEYDKLKEHFHFMMLDYARGLWNPNSEKITSSRAQLQRMQSRTYMRSSIDGYNSHRDIHKNQDDVRSEHFQEKTSNENTWDEMFDFPDLFDDEGRPIDRQQWPAHSTTSAHLQPITHPKKTAHTDSIPHGLSSEVGFCLNCGAPIPKGATYCKKCGHPV